MFFQKQIDFSSYRYKDDEANVYKPIKIPQFTKLEKFYVECVLGGYTDFSLLKNIEKAKLPEDQYELPKDNIERAFDAAAAKYQERRQRIDREKKLRLKIWKGMNMRL